LFFRSGLPSAAVAREAAAKRCLNEGKVCARGNQCCSGLCRQGKCRRAQAQGICTIRKNLCASGDVREAACDADPGTNTCGCMVRVNGAAVCADLSTTGCDTGCERDIECATLFGPGAVCVRDGTGCCGVEGATFCALPCPNRA
jgi:hypothetical protein